MEYFVLRTQGIIRAEDSSALINAVMDAKLRVFWAAVLKAGVELVSAHLTCQKDMWGPCLKQQ